MAGGGQRNMQEERLKIFRSDRTIGMWNNIIDTNFVWEYNEINEIEKDNLNH